MPARILEVDAQMVALLPLDEYQRLLALAEDQMDVMAAAAAEKRRCDGETYFPASVVDALLSDRTSPQD